MIGSESPAAIEAAAEARSGIIDAAHLRRVTLGDGRLEQEILQIFLRQSTLMLDRVGNGEPTMAAVAAHTLKGSARGVGLARLAAAAERFERAIGIAGLPERDAALAELKAAALEASAAVSKRLGAAFAA